MNVGPYDLFFHGSVILSYFLKTVGYMNKMLCNYESVEPNVRPKIIIDHCDLYNMGHRLCLISSRTWDG